MKLISKNFNKIPGIYQITNDINGKIYIGSTINLYQRSNQHYSKLKNSKHPNKKLTNAILKYGIDNFSFTVLISNCKIDELLKLEGLYINKLNPFYNIDEVDINGKRHCSEYTKKLIGKKSKQKFIDNPELINIFKESIGNQAGWNKGMTDIYSEETLKKMSDAGKINISKRDPKIQDKFYEGRSKRHEAQKTPILQFDLNWNFIKEWKSLKEAAEGMGAKSIGNFTTAHKKGIKLFGSYWRKKE